MLAVMAARGILTPILPAPVDPAGVARLIAVEGDAPPAPWRRLAALLDRADLVAPTALRLRLSNHAAASVAAILGAAAIADQPPCRLVRRFGRGAARDGLLLAEARGLPADRAAAQRAGVDRWVEVPLPVSGADVLALGVAPGPRVGALLGQIATWWEDAGCGADRAACLAKLTQLAQA
jgi:hypothetical protein